MRKAPFLRVFVSDYEAKTLHLSCEEHGAYLLLLFAMWRAGGKLPANDARLASIVRLSKARWRTVSSNVLPFFNKDENTLSHDRISEEMQLLFERSSRGKNNADARWKKRAKRNENSEIGNAVASISHRGSHVPTQCGGSALQTKSVDIKSTDFGNLCGTALVLDPETEAANRAPLRSGFGSAQQ